MLPAIQLLPDRPTTCPKALDGEVCRHGRHLREGSEVTPPCPLVAYREAITKHRAKLSKLKPLLLASGWRGDVEQHCLGAALFGALRDRADVTGHGTARHDLCAAARRHPSAEPSRLLVGGPGCGKTSLALALYFSWLREGHRCAWVDWSQLCEVARGRQSFDAQIRGTAESPLRTWAKAEALFLDDLGAEVTSFGQRAAGEGQVAPTLCALLDQFEGVIIATANYASIEMANHPEIGARAVSRLMRAHGGPTREHELTGQDLRQVGR